MIEADRFELRARIAEAVMDSCNERITLEDAQDSATAVMAIMFGGNYSVTPVGRDYLEMHRFALRGGKSGT